MPNAYVLNQFPGSYGEAMSLMTEMLISAGWTYKGSGDGVANFSTTGKIFLTTASGPFGWNNANAWARIQDPGGIREFIFKHDAAGRIQIKYSPFAKFTGAFIGAVSPSNPPTATDEAWVAGALGFDYSNLQWIGLGVTTSSVICMGAAMSAAPYGWWFANQDFPGGVLRGGIMFEPVVSVPEDPDPYVFHIGTTNVFQATSSGYAKDGSSTSNWVIYPYNTSIEGCLAFMDTARTKFAYVQPASYGFGASGSSSNLSLMDAGMLSNPFNGKPEVLPIAYMRPIGPLTARAQYPGLKGWATMARFTGTRRSTFIDTLNNKSSIAVGSLWLPWDGVTTPAGAS